MFRPFSYTAIPRPERSHAGYSAPRRGTKKEGRPDGASPSLEAEKGKGGVVLHFSGDWLARTIGHVESVVEETR